MNDLLDYLRFIIEGHDDIERWSEWFARNRDSLETHLTRSQYLSLKIRRIDAIPDILKSHDVTFQRSLRYQYLAGVPGRCKECGGELLNYERFQRIGGFLTCPNGCFHMHALRRR